VRIRRSSAKNRETTEHGQTLVEFALVFPLFWMVLVGLIEFSFAFSSVLTVSFSSRNAALIAAEAGSAATADCAILNSVENDIGVTTPANQIQKVDIYWTDANGTKKAGFTTTYVRDTVVTPISCKVNGITFTVPYRQTVDGYPMATRCATQSGCAGHPGLDTVGVKVTYRYLYHTPYGVVLGGGGGMTVERSSEMRMEPFQ